jgi:hypothetical protein
MDLTMSDREFAVVNRPIVVNANDPLGPTLLLRCKASAACWSAYKEQMKLVLTGYEGLGLVPLAKAWHAQIDPLVVADPKTETTPLYYAQETAKLYPWLAARPGVIRAQLGIAP